MKAGRSLVNDSFLEISTLDEIQKGDVLTAWATGRVLVDYFEVTIPNPANVRAEVVGTPRHSFRDYLKDFEYQKF